MDDGYYERIVSTYESAAQQISEESLFAEQKKYSLVIQELNRTGTPFADFMRKDAQKIIALLDDAINLAHFLKDEIKKEQRRLQGERGVN